jgi:hypothetical protein
MNKFINNEKKLILNTGDHEQGIRNQRKDQLELNQHGS